MSASAILAIGRLALSLASTVLTYLVSSKLLDAGAKQQLANDLATLQTRLGISKQVADAVAKMSDSDLDNALKGNDP